MAFIRKIKKGDAVYLARVESYREAGVVKQRFLEYVGKQVNGKPVQKIDLNSIDLINVKRYADIKVVFQLIQQLGIDTLFGPHQKSILAVLIAQLLSKRSIVKFFSFIEQSSLCEQLGIERISTDDLYKALDYLNDLNFDYIEKAICDHWAKMAPKDHSAFILDVTDTYYSGRHDGSKLRRGKEGKVAKLVQIGLIVSFEHGFPITHKTYGGNISNMKIFSDLLPTMADRGLKSIILDRGFYSEENVTDLHKMKMNVIVGMKQSIGIKANYLSKIDRNKIYTASNQISLKETVVYAQEFENFIHGKLIILYNPKYEVLKRDKMLADLATPNEVKYVGYSLIYHNTRLTVDKVVKKYFNKDIVERSFKTLKGEIQLHPIRLWLKERVHSHVKLCYLSMCILSLIQFRTYKLGLSASDILKELQEIYLITMKHRTTKKVYTKIITQSNLQKNILKLLKCSV